MSKLSVHLPADVGPLEMMQEVLWLAVRLGALHELPSALLHL